MCTVHLPRLDAWIFLVKSHATFCVIGGIPIALWAYYVS
jgi:hypothetical protein